jgi:hypothetical protein
MAIWDFLASGSDALFPQCNDMGILPDPSDPDKSNPMMIS